MLRRSDKGRARQLTARAARVLDTDRAGAEAGYREAVRLDPVLKEAWFDLGLICKWQQRWQEAFECNMRAAELEGIKADEPAWWNLGIAATALRDWDAARRAWAAYGLQLPIGVGPIEADFGLSPVRINPAQEGEVVWGQRIDPARIRLLSIPFPESGHRWADIVLHDGVPNGSRESGGRPHPVFDELMRWEVSDVPTIEVGVSADDSVAIDALLGEVESAGYAAEDWTKNVRVLCRRCSEGAVHAEHSDTALAAGKEHFIGVAGPYELIRGIVESWADSPGRLLHSIDLAV